jgi:hypothetical protein
MDMINYSQLVWLQCCSLPIVRYSATIIDAQPTKNEREEEEENEILFTD